MKRNHPVLHFLFAILAFGLLTGCETKTGVATQGSGESAKAIKTSTITGGEEGFADGIGGDAKFDEPAGIAIDAAGYLYVADSKNNRIRKITPAGEVNTLAGGEEGFADGIGSDAKFHHPTGIAIDAAGNLYVADTLNHRIRKITPAGEVNTLAGGEEGFADGVGSDAEFDRPADIAIDAAGNLYVADDGNNRIRKITPAGEVSTLAGGEEGFADGIGSGAKFHNPSGIAIDAAGYLYVADSFNHSIRKVTPVGEVSTLVGGKTMFFFPEGIAIDAAGNLYVADSWKHRIRKVTPAGEVSTLTGSRRGFADGIGGGARFFFPSGITIDTEGNLYVSDSGNSRIRKLVFVTVPSYTATVSTLAGSEEGFADGVGSGAKFDFPTGIASDAAGNLYVADTVNDRIRKLTPTGEVSTFAGGERGFADGFGSAARFYSPTFIAIDATGNLYVADELNHRIRKITSTGEVSTLAGGEEGFADGIGYDAKFRVPSGIASDAAGNLYVADYGNHRIRKITPTGEVSTLAGGEEGFADGIGSDAKFRNPLGIASDATGNLYVTDRGNNRIRKITSTGEVSTLAGGEHGFADGIGGSARFKHPSGIASDAAGNLYVADSGNHRIRKIEVRRP
jgi:sugar lactone lactonase YvrE